MVCGAWTSEGGDCARSARSARVCVQEAEGGEHEHEHEYEYEYEHEHEHELE